MKRIVLMLAAGIILAGCEKNPEESAVNPGAGATAAAGSACVADPNGPVSTNGFVAVRIDGKDLTRGDIITSGKVVLQLNMNRARKTKIQRREMRALEHYCKTAVNHEIAKSAVAKYVMEKNLSVPTNVLARARRRFESQYGALSRKLKRRHNINDLKYMLGKNAGYADEMIKEMAVYEVMTNDVIQSSAVIVTDEMVNERIGQIRIANIRAEATNACIFAKATNIWQKIVSKELTFEDAASKYSEDEYISEGCEWGCFTRDQLEGENEVLALLPTLKPGDITLPIESDGGLAILRRDEDDNDKTYSFSRVFFRLPYFYDEETPEQARVALYEEKCDKLIKATLKEYVGKLKIEYPNGTNLVWKLTAQDFR